MGKFVLTKTPDKQFHFRLQATNGEPILSSETYTTKLSAEVGIASVRVNAPLDAQYERKTAANGEFMFNLKGGNGERIGTSETYTSAAALAVGIASCKANAPSATLDDRT